MFKDCDIMKFEIEINCYFISVSLKFEIQINNYFMTDFIYVSLLHSVRNKK